MTRAARKAHTDRMAVIQRARVMPQAPSGLGAVAESLAVTGAELRRLREAAGWTQAEAARLCEVSWRTLVRWEQAKKVPIHSMAAAYIKMILETEAMRRKK